MSKKYLLQYFIDVVQDDERLESISPEDLRDAIASDYLECEEYMVFATLLRWSDLRVKNNKAKSIVDDIRMEVPVVTNSSNNNNNILANNNNKIK